MLLKNDCTNMFNYSFIILIAVGAGGAVTSGIISGSTSGVAGFGILTIYSFYWLYCIFNLCNC